MPEPSVGDRIHQPKGKPEAYGTFTGELEGVPVIIKEGRAAHLTREKAILDRIQSEAIPKALQLTSNGEHARLVMNYLAGTPLDKLVEFDGRGQNRPLPIAHALQIVSSLTSRFEEVNRAGYLYRDLSPNHVIVLDDNAKLVGLVDVERSLEKQPDGSAIVPDPYATWETMAPEEFVPGDRMTEASSTYSLATMLLQLTTGKNPFYVSGDLEPDVERRRELSRFLHARGVDFLPFQGQPLGRVLEKALSPDPANRFATIVEFEQALAELSAQYSHEPSGS